MKKEENRTFLSVKSYLKSFTFAMQSIFCAIKSLPFIRNYLVAIISFLVIRVSIDIGTIDWFYIMYAIYFALIVNLFKSTVLKIVDLAQPEQHKFAQRMIYIVVVDEHQSKQ